MIRTLALAGTIALVISTPGLATERHWVLLKGADVPVMALDPLAVRQAKVQAAMRTLGIAEATAHRLETVAGFIAPLSEATAARLAADPMVAAIGTSRELSAAATAPLAQAPGIHVVAGPGAAAPCFASGVDALCGGGGVFDAGRGRISVGSWTAQGRLTVDEVDALRALDWIAARAVEGSPDVPAGTPATLHVAYDVCASPIGHAIGTAGASAGVVFATSTGAPACLESATRRAGTVISVLPAVTRVIEGKVGGPYVPASLSYVVKASPRAQTFSVSGGMPWLPVSATIRTATATGVTVTLPVNVTGANARPVGVHKLTLRFQNRSVTTNAVLRPVIFNKFGNKNRGCRGVRPALWRVPCDRPQQDRTQAARALQSTGGDGGGVYAVFRRLRAYGRTWTYENLFNYLTSPQTVVPGTSMPAYGFLPATDRHNLVAFLRSLSPGSP
jgi:hypothetical protein